MPRPPAASRFTVAQLEEFLANRRAEIGELEGQKADLFKQIDALDREIRSHGGAAKGRRRRPGKGHAAAVAGGSCRGRRAKNDKSLAEVVSEILTGGGAKRAAEIADAALAAGYKTKSKQFRNVVYQLLIKGKQFKSTGRGLYQLKK